jgi:hypothetical protein
MNINSQAFYIAKYLKYKQKYLQLKDDGHIFSNLNVISINKNQLLSDNLSGGGGPSDMDKEWFKILNENENKIQNRENLMERWSEWMRRKNYEMKQNRKKRDPKYKKSNLYEMYKRLKEWESMYQENLNKAEKEKDKDKKEEIRKKMREDMLAKIKKKEKAYPTIMTEFNAWLDIRDELQMLLDKERKLWNRCIFSTVSHTPSYGKILARSFNCKLDGIQVEIIESFKKEGPDKKPEFLAAYMTILIEIMEKIENLTASLNKQENQYVKFEEPKPLFIIMSHGYVIFDNYFTIEEDGNPINLLHYDYDFLLDCHKQIIEEKSIVPQSA